MYLEEERSRILARVDDLKHRVTELELQLQETKQEVNIITYTHVSLYTVRSTLIVRGLETISPGSIYSARHDCCFQTLTPHLSLGGDGASPAAGGEAGRA